MTEPARECGGNCSDFKLVAAMLPNRIRDAHPPGFYAPKLSVPPDWRTLLEVPPVEWD